MQVWLWKQPGWQVNLPQRTSGPSKLRLAAYAQHLPIILPLCAFAAGFFPTGLAMIHYPAISQILNTSDSLVYNTYYWNVFKMAMFAWNPLWLIMINQMVSYGMLGLLIGGLLMQKNDYKFNCAYHLYGFMQDKQSGATLVFCSVYVFFTSNAE